MTERLQKILAQAGIASRRGAEGLILAGRICVNGEPISSMGVKVDPARDRITFDGRPVHFEQKLTLLLHKPKGYVTTLSDPQGRPIVSDLLKDIPQRLFPVGRLDLDSEGALLMTNDGALGHAILHPSFEVNKTYEALVRGRPDPEKLALLSAGIEIEGWRTSPAKVRLIHKHRHQSNGQSLVEVIIHEGKKRQVRKMFEAIGHRVLALKRTAYGGLRLGALPVGAYRMLDSAELKIIFPCKMPFTIKNIPD